MRIQQYIHGLLNTVYPRCCAACGKVLFENEDILCLNCYAGLPRTRFHTDPDNEVSRIFWGRIQVEYATSFMYFNKDSHFSHILHELKYRGQKKIGLSMGKLFGLELRCSPFSSADLVHPVPLHKSKLKKRGYNQSELIASGISEVLGIPLHTDLVIRKTETSTQTKKTRYERWENVKSSFIAVKESFLENKHILLVDDVITTGATIEACASALLAITGVKVSVASLACVKLQQ